MERHATTDSSRLNITIAPLIAQTISWTAARSPTAFIGQRHRLRLADRIVDHPLKIQTIQRVPIVALPGTELIVRPTPGERSGDCRYAGAGMPELCPHRL